MKATEHKTWSELSPVTQAVLRCKEPVFWVFLKENGYTTKNIHDEETAAIVVRSVCEIESRRELSIPSVGQAIWYGMDAFFQAWKARER